MIPPTPAVSTLWTRLGQKKDKGDKGDKGEIRADAICPYLLGENTL
jgi:hypothetical protein